MTRQPFRLADQPFDSVRAGADFLRVGHRVVDLGARRLLGAEIGQRLTPKAIAVLTMLAMERGRTVTLDELLDRVWIDTCPTVDVVRQVIRELRRVFDNDSASPHCIETIAKTGYRLVADCEFFDTPSKPLPVQDRKGGEAAITAWQPGPTVPLNLQTEVQPCLSPDGSRIVFAGAEAGGRYQLFVRPADGTETTALTHFSEGSAGFPAWSPCGARIAFYHWTRNHCQLVVLHLFTGNQQIFDVCRPGDPCPLEWFPNGRALLVSHRCGRSATIYRLYRLDLQNGSLTPFGEIDPEAGTDHAPRFSPDGVWLAIKRGNPLSCDLWLLPLSDPAMSARRITHLQACIQGHTWLPDGRGLVFSSYHLGHYALFMVELANTKPEFLNLSHAACPAIRRDGTLVYQRICKQARLRELTPAASMSPTTQVLLPDFGTGSDFCPMFSPDGRYLAFISTRSGNEQVWILDRQDGACFQLTRLTDGDIKRPAWDQVGRQLSIPVWHGDHAIVYEADLHEREVRQILRTDIQIESVAYAVQDNVRWLAAAGAGTPRLRRLLLNANTSSTLAAEAEDAPPVQQLQTRVGDDDVYYRDGDDGALCRFDPATRSSGFLTIPFLPWQWQLSASGIELLRRLDDQAIEVWRYDLARHCATRLSGPHPGPERPAPPHFLAGYDPGSGSWVGPTLERQLDDIGRTKLDVLKPRT